MWQHWINDTWLKCKVVSSDATIIDFVGFIYNYIYYYSLRNNHGFTIIMHLLISQHKITSGGPLSALTCCVNVRLLSGDKKNIAVNLFSKLGWELGLYYASYDDFHPDILARMYT